MDEPTPSRGAAACWACRRLIDAGDPYCRWCGRNQSLDNQWYYRPAWIVVLTLTVLGPFTLPLVWRAPALSRSRRWSLTLFILTVTALAFYLFYLLVNLSYIWFDRLNQVGNELL